MKQEKTFTKNGCYTFVLESNLLLHKQVADRARKFLSGWLLDKPADKPVRLLDLACGGAPVSISSTIAAFPEHVFHYTGIDINPDQAEAARRFQFPKNVVKIVVLEGNAWDFSSLPLDEEYDVIFTGLNIHHGSPEEIYCLLLQCKTKLSQDGMFINHDFYRPGNSAYLRGHQLIRAIQQNPSL